MYTQVLYCNLASLLVGIALTLSWGFARMCRLHTRPHVVAQSAATQSTQEPWTGSCMSHMSRIFTKTLPHSAASKNKLSTGQLYCPPKVSSPQSDTVLWCSVCLLRMRRSHQCAIPTWAAQHSLSFPHPPPCPPFCPPPPPPTPNTLPHCNPTPAHWGPQSDTILDIAALFRYDPLH